MIRLVAFDLDGTLMSTDLKISPRVQQAIAQAQRAGVVVTLATGRMFSATCSFAQQLNITAPLICYQGGWIQAKDDPSPRYRISLDVAIAKEAITLAKRNGWHTVLYADGKLFIAERVYPQEFYHALLGSDLTIGLPWETILLEHTPDKVLFVAEPTMIPSMGETMVAHFGQSVEIVRSHAHFIEIVPQGVEKGNALAWLARDLDIPRSQVLAVGDQQNDLSMIIWAGVGVAMGNAIPTVQAHADWVAPPLDEDGAAVILERFVLRQC